MDNNFHSNNPVSYTHLDVYKRQLQPTAVLPKYVTLFGIVVDFTACQCSNADVSIDVRVFGKVTDESFVQP